MTMSIRAIPDEVIRRKKMVILVFGVMLYFLTSMAKVLIPGSIFNDLQQLGLNAAEISSTGAAFMYAYACSQIIAGVFSNRYGGVRILLIGGTLFAVGTIGFPLPCVNYPIMLICRMMAGLGAGTVFLGVVKLVNDLFSAKFGVVLGAIMLCSYLGPTCGTTPMVMLVTCAGWRTAMLIPGIAAALEVTGIVLMMRGTIKPIQRGETVKPLLEMLKNREMWLLSMTSSIIFGSYYVLSSQIGSKSIADHSGLSMSTASAIIMGMTIITALNNVGGNLLLKGFGGQRKVTAMAAFGTLFAGTLLGYCGFKFGHSVLLPAAGFVLIAYSAGFFPIFSLIAKEINPPENVGLAIALLNGWCFIFIAAFQNISGRILKNYAPTDGTAYASAAYCAVFIFLIIAAGIGLAGSALYRETSPAAAKGKTSLR